MSYREYKYVGPIEILESARLQPAGVPIESVDKVLTWLESRPTENLPDGSWIATFTISIDCVLSLAPRRSEHVACAGGGPVLSAGEITFADSSPEVIAITNQSTGFCPEPNSWEVVERVLDEIGFKHPGEFTNQVIFRRCESCGERNIVKDAWFFCELCEAKLPEFWNFADS